ncbi:hypothetical protein DRO19_00300 [Candidatus Bathyarchaeota archaeon]|nr:MAG: hypothetical protein DRO19_00300 [Candidatus Bathyarchaeota archaeon]
MNKEVVEIPLDRLRVHPVNRQIYVSDSERKAELLESIRQHGILEPLIVMPQDDGFLILSGARRFECARELGFKAVPCIITHVEDPVLAIIEYNRYRKKTAIEIYNELQVLKERLSETARLKQLSKLKPFQDSSFDKIDKTEAINTRRIAAQTLGVSEGYLSMLEQVVEHKDLIPDVFERLKAGRETVYSAYSQLRSKLRKDVEIPGIFIGQYFAGKQKIVKDIIMRIPRHHCYVEPFGGFCSVLLNKPLSPVEIYNDISKDVVNLLICIRDYPIQLISELEMLPWSRWLYERLIGVLDEPFEIPDVERAAIWYYLNESTFDAMHSEKPTPGDWRRATTRNHAALFRKRWKMLLWASRRLQNVMIECRDYREVLELNDSPETFFYIDPPYYETDDALGISWNHNQHKELASVVSKLKGKWLITYNDHPEIRKLYRKYKIEKIVISRSAVHPKYSDGVRGHYVHLLIMNYDWRKQ